MTGCHRGRLFALVIIGLWGIAGPLRAEAQQLPWQNRCNNPGNLSKAQICGACPNLAPKTVKACNPDNWDCAKSLMYAPSDGSGCSYAPAGPCECPAPQSPHRQ